MKIAHVYAYSVYLLDVYAIASNNGFRVKDLGRGFQV